MPPLALALGCYLNQLVPRARQQAHNGMQSLWRWHSRLAGGATLLVLALSIVLLALAGFKHLLKPSTALILGTLAGSSFVFLCTRRLSWGACIAVTFVVLAFGVYYLQPAYNRQFALRDSLPSQDIDAENGELSILCYPQRWDSVSFYLPQAQVRVYTREQRRQLLADLCVRPKSLLLVKSGKPLEELLRELPSSLELVPQDRPGLVTAGWIRPLSQRANRPSDENARQND
jgi:hypothetical protein